MKPLLFYALLFLSILPIFSQRETDSVTKEIPTDTLIVEKMPTGIPNSFDYFFHSKRYIDSISAANGKYILPHYSSYSNPSLNTLGEYIFPGEEKITYFVVKGLPTNVHYVFLYPDGNPVDIPIVTDPDEVRKIWAQIPDTYPQSSETETQDTESSDPPVEEEAKAKDGFNSSNCTITAKGKTISLSNRTSVSICFTDSESSADLRVYITDNWAGADLKVDSSGRTSCGTSIVRTDSWYYSDFRIYITNSWSSADLIVYYEK